MPGKLKSPEEVSTINVTPLCDVMLVLLIIFMVITPLLQNNVSVDMVESRNAVDMDAANKSDAAVISVTRDGNFYLGSQLITADSITKDVENKLEHNLDKTVYLKADSRAKYGDVLTVAGPAASSWPSARANGHSVARTQSAGGREQRRVFCVFPKRPWGRGCGARFALPPRTALRHKKSRRLRKARSLGYPVDCRL
jgi:biopolymer transport protein ExbD